MLGGGSDADGSSYQPVTSLPAHEAHGQRHSGGAVEDPPRLRDDVLERPLDSRRLRPRDVLGPAYSGG